MPVRADAAAYPAAPPAADLAGDAIAQPPEEPSAGAQQTRELPKWLLRSFACLILSGQVLMRILQGRIHVKNTLDQLKLVGPRSLGVALLTAGFVGMVFTIQVCLASQPACHWHILRACHWHSWPMWHVTGTACHPACHCHISPARHWHTLSACIQTVCTLPFGPLAIHLGGLSCSTSTIQAWIAVCKRVCKARVDEVRGRRSGLGARTGAHASGHVHHSCWPRRECICCRARNDAGAWLPAFVPAELCYPHCC